MNEILKVQNLDMHFGGVPALTDVSFSVDAGTIAGFVGSNGAGKTTLFNVLGGYMRPDGGRIIYRDSDLAGATPEKRAMLGIGRLWQDVRVFRNLTVLENLVVSRKRNQGEAVWRNFLAPRSVASARRAAVDFAEFILATLGLQDRASATAKNLSFGQQKLLAFGRLLMNETDLLLLDEPFAGIDPGMMARMQGLLRYMADQGRTVLIIEHNLPLMLEICDTISIMEEGRVSFVGPAVAAAKHHWIGGGAALK